MRGLGTDHVISATATNPPPANSGLLLLLFFFFFSSFIWPPLKKILRKLLKQKTKQKWCHRIGILGGRELTRGLHNLRIGCFELSQTHRQTSRQTDGHGDSMTELVLWGQYSGNML